MSDMPTISRDDLITAVNQASVAAELSDQAADAMVEAVSNPSVTRVAVATYVDEANKCVCPIVLAKLYDPDHESVAVDYVSSAAADLFVMEFDEIMADAVHDSLGIFDYAVAVTD